MKNYSKILTREEVNGLRENNKDKVPTLKQVDDLCHTINYLYDKVYRLESNLDIVTEFVRMFKSLYDKFLSE